MYSKQEQLEKYGYYIGQDGKCKNADGSDCFIDDENRIFTEKNLDNEANAKYVEIKNFCFSEDLDFRFYKFNPFDTHTIPLAGNGCLFEINRRALDILKIDDFADLNVIMQRFRSVIINASYYIDDEDEIGDGYGRWLLSDVATLVKGYIDAWVFDYEEIFQDGLSLEESKPQIFALLAIYLIGSICNQDIDVNRTQSVMMLAVQAMEAVCMAERLKNLSEPTEELKKRIEEQYKIEAARKAGKAKQSPYKKVGTIAAVNELLEKHQALLGQHGGKAALCKMIRDSIAERAIPAYREPAEKTVMTWIKNFQNRKSTS